MGYSDHKMVFATLVLCMLLLGSALDVVTAHQPPSGDNIQNNAEAFHPNDAVKGLTQDLASNDAVKGLNQDLTPNGAVKGSTPNAAVKGSTQPNDAVKGSTPNGAVKGSTPNTAVKGLTQDLTPNDAVKGSTPNGAVKGSTPNTAVKGSTPNAEAKGLTQPNDAEKGSTQPNDAEKGSTQPNDAPNECPSTAGPPSVAPAHIDAHADYVNPQNKARAAVGVAPLTWNDTVAAYAKNYANQRAEDCELIHSHGPYGENLAQATWDALPSEVVKWWVDDEKPFYDYNSNKCVGGDCGHYIQVVSNTSFTVGCAKVKCKNDKGYFIGCNYSPPGHYIGVKPY